MLAKLQVDPHTPKLYMATLCNGEVCGIETRNKKVGGESNHYKIGVEITKTKSGNFAVETWTIWGGQHVLNSCTIVDADGKLVQSEPSMVHCFGLGYIGADQDWVDMLIDELQSELMARRRDWDVRE